MFRITYGHYNRLFPDRQYRQHSVNLGCQKQRYEGISANGRRTFRAEELLRKIAFSTSCLAAEKVAHAAHIPISHDTLLAIVRRTALNPEVSPFPRFG